MNWKDIIIIIFFLIKRKYLMNDKMILKRLKIRNDPF